MSPLYVYAAVAQAPADYALPLVGLGGAPLHLARAGAVLVAVSRVEAPPPVDEPSLRGHDDAVRRLAAVVPALLPFRFGTVLDDETALARRMEPLEAELLRALSLVAGREQMTLRIFQRAPLADPPSVAGSDVDGAPELGPGARYLDHRRRAARATRTLPELDPVRVALAAHVAAERVERHRARAAPGELLASVYQLVARGRTGISAYRAALDRALPLVPALRVSVTGPWPPYAFAPAPLDGPAIDEPAGEAGDTP